MANVSDPLGQLTGAVPQTPATPTPIIMGPPAPTSAGGGGGAGDAVTNFLKAVFSQGFGRGVVTDPAEIPQTQQNLRGPQGQGVRVVLLGGTPFRRTAAERTAGQVSAVGSLIRNIAALMK